MAKEKIFEKRIHPHHGEVAVIDAKGALSLVRTASGVEYEVTTDWLKPITPPATETALTDALVKSTLEKFPSDKEEKPANVKHPKE